MRRASAVDGNHNRIADALRKVGAWVWSTAPLGNGFPDLLVWFRGRFLLLEVKDDSQPPSKRGLTPKERLFSMGCPGPVHTVENVPGALRAIGVTTWPGDARETAFHGPAIAPKPRKRGTVGVQTTTPPRGSQGGGR